MKAFRLSGGAIQTTYGSSSGRRSAPLFHSAPLFNLYAQAISLNHINYYGLGPDTAPGRRDRIRSNADNRRGQRYRADWRGKHLALW